MAEFTVLVEQFSAKLKDFYNNLSVTRKVAILIAIIVLVSSLLSLLLFQKDEKWNTLYTDLSDADLVAMNKALSKKNISGYQIAGNTLRVKQNEAMNVKLELAQEGLPSGGVVGWEMFDKTNFSVTDFELNINKKRAIEGELSRTINKLAPIQQSRVHIVLPKNRLFLEDKHDPTSAIYVKLKQGKTLSIKQIRGMQYLVARSVEGLETKNITIVDGEGNVLTEEEEDVASNRFSKAKMSYKKRVEKEYVNKIRTLIGRIVGGDKVMAAVTADIDFKEVSLKQETFNPEQQVVRSTKLSDDDMKGTGFNPTGIPGSKANLPAENVDIKVSKNTSTQKRSTQTVNYEIGKTISTTIKNVGDLIKLSVSVLVDGRYSPGLKPTDPPIYEPRTKEEMDKIDSLIKQAVGFQVGRGDAVTIENMRFKEDVFASEERQRAIIQEKEIFRDIAMIAAVALSLIFFFIFVVKPYLRWLTHDPSKLRPSDAEVGEFRPDLEKSGLKKIEIQEEVPFDKLSPREQIIYMAKHEPLKTTEALRMLLSPANR